MEIAASGTSVPYFSYTDSASSAEASVLGKKSFRGYHEMFYLDTKRKSDVVLENSMCRGRRRFFDPEVLAKNRCSVPAAPRSLWIWRSPLWPGVGAPGVESRKVFPPSPFLTNVLTTIACMTSRTNFVRHAAATGAISQRLHNMVRRCPWYMCT